MGEDSREDNSDAFLLFLRWEAAEMGCHHSGCCLWQVVWKVNMQEKHFTGFAGFLITRE